MRKISMSCVALALIAGACTEGQTATTSTTVAPMSSVTLTTTTAPTTTTSIGATTTSIGATTTTSPVVSIAYQQPRSAGAFAAFTLMPPVASGEYAGPAWPTSLDGVAIPPEAEYILSNDEAVTQALVRNGFVVLPGYNWLFQDVYAKAPYDNHAVFVTTDVGYHILHLAFSKTLRDTEEGVLLPILEDMTERSLTAARAQTDTYAGTDLADMAGRVAALFEAAGALLGIDTGPIGPLAQEEADLARAGLGMKSSPITGFQGCDSSQSPRGCVDYSLFKPRGHYTRSRALERYFRTMSLLGQESAQFVASDVGGRVTVDPQAMRFALLLAQVLTADPAIEEDWDRIYEPTVFMVGMADDYTPYELVAAARSVAGGDWTNADLTDDVFLQQVGVTLLAGRSVGIDPEAASVRIMGARFVIDSFILDQLAWPNVGEEEPIKRRVFMSPLDVAAAMGSGLALDVQLQAGEDHYLHYTEQMAAMQKMIAARDADAWGATVYDAWLAALEPVWSERGTAYPPFMQGDAWAAKDLQTGLGSYTELKHDTILYAKQAFAAEGGGDWTELNPRHWVEPNPAAFSRTSQVAAMLEDGLSKRGLLTADDASLLDGVRDLLDRLTRLATDELAGAPITDEDNEWLGGLGSVMEALWYASSDADPATGAVASGDSRDALVADIARTSSFYLEIGTGAIDQLFVLVPDDSGRFQIALGGVYSYYEFWRDKDEGRLTDEEWWRLLDQGGAPDRSKPMELPDPDGGTRLRPAWQAALLEGSG